jgi:hypothetical protein
MEEAAFEISNILQVSRHCVSLLITAHQKYNEAATLIHDQKSEFPTAKSLLMEFGPLLLRQEQDTAGIIEQTASDLWKKYLTDDDDQSYLKVFWGVPLSAKQFLIKAVHDRPTPLFVNSLIELLIPRNPAGTFFGHPDVASAPEALEYINDPKIPFDDIDPLLQLCTEVQFSAGLIALLKRGKRHSELVAFLIAEQKSNELVEWVDTNPPLQGADWLAILRYFGKLTPDRPADGTRSMKSQDTDFMRKLLSNSLQARSLFSLVSELCVNSLIPFEAVKPDITRELTNVCGALEAEQVRHRRLIAELDELEKDVNRLENDEIAFRPISCDKCKSQLTPPYVGFFCMHMVHQTCCELGPDGDHACPICSEREAPRPRAHTVIAPQTGEDLLDSIVALIGNGGLS